MKSINKYIALGAVVLSMASCSDFLDVVPNDALSPTTTWKDSNDAEKFLTGCYDGWENATNLVYWDAGSDFGYNNFSWEGMRPVGDGSMSPSNPGWDMYSFGMINRCNELLDNVDKCEFADEASREDMKAQARFLRAYQYFLMNWNYGGVPIIEHKFSSSEEAQVARNSEEEVRSFVDKELEELTPKLSATPAKRGRVAQGAAYALRMRQALYYGKYETAMNCAEAIMNLGYSLDPDYSNLFNVAGQGSPEIILAVQYIPNTKATGVIGQLYNNGEGGWSSVVPTYNLIDTYEMANGMTIDEAGSGYDAVHPFKNRDPRMRMTVLYPGCDYTYTDGSTAIFNTLDQELNGSKNANYWAAADNASKTGLTWAKYQDPITQYADIWSANTCPIVFRYAEALLTYAEAANEQLGAPNSKAFDCVDEVRKRAGMPEVDRTKYASQEKFRELVRRERAVEFAGEGMRRADILRWKTADGKMVAEKVLNGNLERRVGTVSMDASVAEGDRATINTSATSDQLLIETRKFSTHNRYLPIPQSAIDANPKLVQNSGYKSSE